MKTTTQLKDMQGNILQVGDRVAFVGYHNAQSLTIGVVKKLGRVRAEVAYKGLWDSKLVLDTINTQGLVKV